jgi:two-component system response regulator
MSNNVTSLNVLLVEDSEDDRYMFQHVFKRIAPKARLFMANDGTEALDFFQNQGRFSDSNQFPRPDIVFLDLKMPGRNGFEVLSWMRESSLLPSVKVFVLSGSSEPPDIDLARKLGACDYLVKPLTNEGLQEILKP